MALTLNWSEDALGDILDILRFIARDNVAAALEMDRAIAEAAEKLTVFPYLGRLGRVENTREFFFHPNYFLVYEIDHGIFVLNVLHGRRQYP